MFNEKMSEAMEAREIKATDLAKMTGIPKSTISNYMTGRMAPKRGNLHKIALALNVQEAWLLDYDVAMDRPATRDEYAEETLKMLRQLSPEQQKIVTSLIEQIISK